VVPGSSGESEAIFVADEVNVALAAGLSWLDETEEEIGVADMEGESTEFDATELEVCMDEGKRSVGHVTAPCQTPTTMQLWIETSYSSLLRCYLHFLWH
jgi:hypothetical protein